MLNDRNIPDIPQEVFNRQSLIASATIATMLGVTVAVGVKANNPEATDDGDKVPTTQASELSTELNNAAENLATIICETLPQGARYSATFTLDDCTETAQAMAKDTPTITQVKFDGETHSLPPAHSKP